MAPTIVAKHNTSDTKPGGNVETDIGALLSSGGEYGLAFSEVNRHSKSWGNNERSGLFLNSRHGLQ